MFIANGIIGCKQTFAALVLVYKSCLDTFVENFLGYRLGEYAQRDQFIYSLAKQLFSAFYIEFFAGAVAPYANAVFVIDENGIADSLEHREKCADSD